MIQKILDEVYEMEKLVSQETAHKVHWWRSSALGSCKRGQLLGRLLSGDFKIQHDRRTMDVFEIGNIVEDIKIAKLKKHPDYLIISQGEMFDKVFNLSGHFDAIVIHLPTGTPYMFECKSKNSRAFTYMDKKKEGAMHHHKLQINSYMYMTNNSGFALADEESHAGDPAYDWLMKNATVFATKPRNDGKGVKAIFKLAEAIVDGFILYVSKDDQRLLEYPVSATDASLLTEWQGELNLLNTAWQNKDVLPENESGSWQGKYCQYCQAGLCEKMSSKEVVESLFEVAEQEEKKAVNLTPACAHGTYVNHKCTLCGAKEWFMEPNESVLECGHTVAQHGNGETCAECYIEAHPF